MRLSILPRRWFARRAASISNGWRFLYQFYLVWIPALWTVQCGMNMMAWTMLTGRNAGGPRYPTMPVAPGGAMTGAIMAQQAESMNTAHPVPMEFARAILHQYTDAYDEDEGHQDANL